MPNGRSGGFIMQTADLKGLIRALSGSTLVGHMLGHDLSNKSANALDVDPFVEACTQGSVAVEEQHHDSYIIHLGNKPITWISVTSGSPLFPELRQRHAQWMAEHPDWKDWMWF